MSFKNALKNLIAHFGMVWSLLLYIIIFAAIITGISLPFVLPIASAFEFAGVFDSLKDAFSSVFSAGGFEALWTGLFDAYHRVMGVFGSDDRVAALTRWFIIFIVLLAFRFFLGLYEIPFATVTDGQLSCNARYGFGGKFFSTLPQAMLYSVMKMLYTLVFDAIVTSMIYGIGKGMGMGLPFIFTAAFVVLVLWSLRFSMVAGWAPCVVDGSHGVFRGFACSVKLCFKNFGTVYSTYFISLLLIFAIGAFITIFTFGVGLIIVMPLSATYVCQLNGTVYYNKTGKRYYVDGAVITPPAVDKTY